MKITSSQLDALHQALADALAALERIGEFAAAAHVAAALDSIEDRIEASRPKENGDRPDGAIATIARLMREAFGEGAETVARKQLVAASGTTLLAWAAIVNQIMR